MYSIAVKATNEYNEYLLGLADFLGLEISNPDQTNGDRFYFLPEKNIAGFDILYKRKEPDFILPKDINEFIQEIMNVYSDRSPFV